MAGGGTGQADVLGSSEINCISKACVCREAGQWGKGVHYLLDLSSGSACFSLICEANEGEYSIR
jgi:hypothetical protein